MTAEAILEAGVEQPSIFQSNLPLEDKLDRARMELLDLSGRNRLLNMPRSSKSARLIEVIDEKSAEIFRLLVRDGRPFTFVAGKAAPGGGNEAVEVEEITDLAQPEDETTDERGVLVRHSDTRLQTRLTPKGLQKRLLDLYFDARTLEEEQGVNILFLTLGTLKWIDPQNTANVRYAPLILVPVALERGNAGEKFKLRARPDDFASNLSLETFLDRLHSLKLPAFDATDSFDLVAYMEGVAQTVVDKPGWVVQPDDVTLGFFSFAKFLMYRDLDPETWPEGGRISDHSLVRGLLTDGFATRDDLIPEDAKIDPFIPPVDMLHIVDSDSSQALAVHEVRRGRDMVIQGPPGTGKSQTIANIIASAVADGKLVLFVAEKMAALEVVKRRLDATGVGAACLELHSNKANKRTLLEELRRTWELGAPRGQDPGALYTRLTEARDSLNNHAERMHAPHSTARLTPYQVIGQLSRLRLDGERPNDIHLDSPENWSPEAFRQRHDVLSELVERVKVIGRPANHIWRGAELTAILPTDVERLTTRIADLATRLANLDADQTALAKELEQTPAQKLDGLAILADLARRVAGAPSLSGKALGDMAWDHEMSRIEELLAIGETHQRLRSELARVFVDAAWTTDTAEARQALLTLPETFALPGFERLSKLAALLPRLITETSALARLLGRDTVTKLIDCARLARIGERVASAPEASPEAFAAGLWDDGIERAGDLVNAIATLETARNQIGDSLLEVAWSMDFGPVRSTLAAHGTGFFRIFSSEWRRANRLVRTVLAKPDESLDKTLVLLDALRIGQAALRKVETESDFGRSAFGVAWRDDRSASAPLSALVEWMRSLKGLGAEPRLIASRRPDRGEASARAGRVQTLVAEVMPIVESLWNDLSEARTHGFQEAPSSDSVDISGLLAFVSRLHEADRVTGAIMGSVLAELPERLTYLAHLQEGQAAATALTDADSLGRQAFDTAWKASESDWGFLRAAENWIGDNGDIRILASRIEDRSAPANHAATVEGIRDILLTDLGALFDSLHMNPSEALDTVRVSAVPLPALISRLRSWSEAGEQLSKWVAYRDRAARGRELGCADVVGRLEDGRLSPATGLPAFEMAYYEAIYTDQVRTEPPLGRFDGTLHDRLARDFANLDRQRIASASVEVVRAHHKRVPPRDGSAVGPLGVLRAEIQKRRGHMPIRKLMERAGAAVQALKPVFMMSPLSVAQFLPQGMFEFDLLVMDEASQIQPVDALGAVARAKQVVVVGDPKQLPPTAFFSKMTNDGSDSDDDDGARVSDIESVLGLFTARGLPTRMLRWHYRSRHQSLIAVSNKQFYESKLFIVPSPYTAEAGMGLRFHHIAQGLFDTGGTRTNVVEAKIVAQAIVAHARDHSNLSLGVAAFSAAQRRAILDQLELLRRALPPETEAFFQSHQSEPFFVKNLENVQGDERDVIFISVGYGPTVIGGRVPMRFGPLGSDGGERRLNVLISRAKQRCEVFASMTDEDIDPDFASSRKGVFAFRLFLHYARTGRLTMAESTGRDHDSVFEEQVAKSLQARGYQVHRQVGLAGFFIDLAVADAERPGRYLLGIECDGIAYHGARSARDRDRLRQSVLESHGWAIHRIWSSDWFQRPNEQLELIISRIEAAKAEHDAQGVDPTSRRAMPIEIFTVEREDETEMGLRHADGATSTDSRLYVEAVLSRPSHNVGELHEAPTGILITLAEQVVTIEGPVHVDEIVDRIRNAWGLKRAGSRIQDAVKTAITTMVKVGRLNREGDFLSVPGASVSVRDRSNANSPTLRRPEMLPPAEIRSAAIAVVRANFGATSDQVIQAVSRSLGFKSTSSQLRAAILAVVENALNTGALRDQAGVLVASD